MQKKKALVLALMATMAVSGTCFASPDSHPLYINEQVYRQADEGELEGAFTKDILDKIAKPAQEALDATYEDTEAAREQMKLPEEMYLLPLSVKDFRKMPDSHKRLFIATHYAKYVKQMNKLIASTDDAEAKAFYGAAEALVRNYVSSKKRADGKAAVAEWFDKNGATKAQEAFETR
jgi:hypothetical protein